MKFIKETIPRKHKNILYKYSLFHCDYCNKEVEKMHCNGIRAKSCGCSKNKLSGILHRTHGDSVNRKRTRLYRIWDGIKQRCNNINNKNYKDYGDRGIAICKQWEKQYAIFKKWALSHGYKDNLIIDRIDNNKNYEPTNCRFVNIFDSNINKRNIKLNKDLVCKMRKEYNENNLKYIDISKKYNTDYYITRNAIKMISWNNI